MPVLSEIGALHDLDVFVHKNGVVAVLGNIQPQEPGEVCGNAARSLFAGLVDTNVRELDV
ncbi:hypothetical protein SDC9_123211 [bioreactor metagenome]|uniref:Uncharacterized protein n=1 Tax=bioreactor metagenome TaxID=1076179 RepID=A0A645CH50_9ZZZZ